MADDLYDGLVRELFRGRDRGENYKTVKKRLWETVEGDTVTGEAGRYFQMFFHNWFNNNWARWTDEPSERRKSEPKPYNPRPRPTPEQLREQRKADANLKGITIMNMFLSDGETRLKDATGKQIRAEVGWLQLIAKYVKPNEIVGRKLTAEQLFNLKEQSSAKIAA